MIDRKRENAYNVAKPTNVPDPIVRAVVKTVMVAVISYDQLNWS
jgi:hypothetical protein